MQALAMTHIRRKRADVGHPPWVMFLKSQLQRQERDQLRCSGIELKSLCGLVAYFNGAGVLRFAQDDPKNKNKN
jgi:hypothetical protein